jgi:hypothetical protein
MTPFILAVIRSTSLGSEGCFDVIRIALDETTVEIAFKPAARIVSPDSTRSTMPSATPSAHAASTLPPTYLMFVFSLASLAPSPLVWPLCSASSLRKYCSARFVNEVTTFLPIRSSGLARSPFDGTWTCRLHLPKSRSRTSTTPVVAVVGGGEEDEREGEVFDERNVEARVAVELDVGAVEEVEADLVEAALCLLVLEV